MDGEFTAMIASNPNDPSPRLVYSDWLEEQGRAEDASYQRLMAAVAEFVNAANDATETHWKMCGFTFSQPPRHRADVISAKWIRVVQVVEQGGVWKDGSVYGFIAIADNATKGLGCVKIGDIHMAAGWRRPARHARGNVFDPDFRKCMTSHGIVYLRN